MPAYLSPLFNEPQSDANGAPLAGGLLFTYLAGSVNTPATTYTSSAGTVPQANPIVLNSRGCPDNPVWLAAGVAYKFVLQDSGGNTLAPTFDNVQGINDPAATSSQTEWASFAATPTFLTATTFSVPGDQTATLQQGRRVRTANASGFVYSTITGAVFSGVTTVTVVNDGATLDAGLSAVSYGLLAASNPSVPQIAYPVPNNRVINGACLVSQYGSRAIANATAMYGGCDRTGIVVTATTASGTLSQQNPAVAGIGTYGKVQSATITTTGTTSITWFSRLEGKHVKDMGGQSVIFACKVYQNSGVTQAYTPLIFKANAPDNFSVVTALATGPTTQVPSGVATTLFTRATLNAGDADNGIQVQVSVTAFGAVTAKQFDISDIFFDVGTTQMEYQLPAPNYSTELLRCQRYFWTAPLFGSGYQHSTTVAAISFPAPVEMRVAPTFAAIATTSRFVTGGSAAGIAGTWTVDSAASVRGAAAFFTRAAATWTAFDGIVLSDTGGTSPFSLSAEL